MNILVTGGAGYIGSHTVITLLEAGHSVSIVDNFSNSSPNVIPRLEKLSGTSIPTHKIDLLDKPALSKLFTENSFDAVMHFAGLKAVGESTEKPLDYYHTNIGGTINLLECMSNASVFKFVFSSSATVYGSAPIPYNETATPGIEISNPYGQTKYMIERILADLANSDSRWQIMALRYFNPVGAHESGMIGEQPQGKPNNLMPFIVQVASKEREVLSVFGNDYDTPDGTCVRDYIHIQDLASGHLRALEHLKSGFSAINLGSGNGTSVLELIATFERTNKVPVPYEVVSRRSGDLASYYASPQKALQELGWQTTRSLEDMCRDSWNWHLKNPSGYE